MSTTDDARRKARERYAYLKRLGLCVTCGYAPAMPGRVRCIDCLSDNAVSQFVRKAAFPTSAEAKERMRQINRQHYAERKAAGICVTSGCGKPAWNGRVRCKACAFRNLNSANESRRKRMALEPVREPKPRHGNPHPTPPGPNHPWRMANKLIANPLRRKRGGTE
nr:MAG TPA: hypothetical protein [Caudoviricetes sp.]